MGRVLLAEHQGIACAFPAEQILSVARAWAGEGVIHLFAARSVAPPESQRLPAPLPSPPASQSYLFGATAVGERVIRCRRARFVEIPDREMVALPALLVEAMALPHVVGAARSERGLVWLVDLSKWSEPADEPLRDPESQA